MYFIVNNEGYIVAASKNFLQKCGSRDVCSVANSLKDGIITLDSDSKSFHAKDFDDYEYSCSELFSAFGAMKLYNISKKVEPIIETAHKKDENIQYLKQLKEGKIEKSDNEFSIPTIESLHKKEIEETPTEIQETLRVADTDKEVAAKVTSDNNKEPQEESTVDIKEETTTDSIETIKLYRDTHAPEKGDNANENIKLHDYSTTPKETLPKTIEELEETNVDIETSTKEDIAQIIDEEKSDETNVIKDEYIHKHIIETEESTKDENIEPTKVVNIPASSAEEEHKEEAAKKSGLAKLKEKLFPWGSKSKNKIELEEKDDEVLKTANELKTQEEKIESQEQTPSALDSLLDKEFKSTETEAKDSEYQSLSQESPTADNAALETKEEKSTFDHVKEVVASTAAATIAVEAIRGKDDNTEEAKEEHKIVNEEITQEPIKIKNESLSNIEPEEIEKHEEPIETTEEKVVTSIEEKIQTSDTPKIDTANVAETKERQEEEKVEAKSENIELYNRIIQIQIDNIDFDKNAQNLNIDTDSYKMLAKNYLDELENYNEDIHNKVNSTITMLSDAGELLLLNPISKKLNEIASSNNSVAQERDLTLLISLLKEKISDTHKKEALHSETHSQQEVSEVHETQIVAKKEDNNSVNTELDVIEITSAQHLLSSIPEKEISFDPQKAADDLNLPKSLIIEFVGDFIEQSKEHLSQIVKAFQDGDLKTIQTTAHMLKGAANNLRIDSLAETLFAMQNLQTLNGAEQYLKDFVAKLKGLKTTLQSIEGSNNEN